MSIFEEFKMKRGNKYICLLITLLWALASAENVSISFTSLNITTGTYEPERDVIVYIVDNNGTFVRTLATWGSDLEDDIPWNIVSSGSTVDAVSGATIKSSSPQPLKSSWDGKDADKTNVTNGSYWLIISANSRERNASPSRLKIKLDIGGAKKTITSADSSFSNGAGYLTDLSIVITSTGYKPRTAVNNSNRTTILLAYKPIYILENDEKLSFSLFSLSGRCIFKQILSQHKTDNCIHIPVQHISGGTYMYLITSKTDCISDRIVLKQGYN